MIKSYENTLKHIIIDVLGASDKTNYGISDDVKKKWFEKRKLIQHENDGFLNEKRIIFYADLFDLKTIIENNWKVFEAIFKNKERFLVFFNEVYQLKNTINLGKELTKSQLELLSGITTDLKNNYTKFSNKKNSRSEYFININAVSDNLGTTWEKSTLQETKKPILKVGDEYELLVDANDPKDREIEYQLFHFAGSFRVTQKENRFNFTITEDLIGLETLLVIKAHTPEAEYKNESILKLFITVNPN